MTSALLQKQIISYILGRAGQKHGKVFTIYLQFYEEAWSTPDAGKLESLMTTIIAEDHIQVKHWPLAAFLREPSTKVVAKETLLHSLCTC